MRKICGERAKVKDIIWFSENDSDKIKKESGDDDVVDTPVPIPNTEVKHHRGYGIRKGRAASCRALFFCFHLIFYYLLIVILIMKYKVLLFFTILW